MEAIDKFAGKYDLGFTLLADADHAVAENYGAWVEKSMYGKKYMGVQRATFIIDPEGKIAKVFPKVSAEKARRRRAQGARRASQPTRLGSGADDHARR